MTTEKRETTEDFIYATEEFRDTIATVTKEGKRIWIYPKNRPVIFLITGNL